MHQSSVWMLEKGVIGRCLTAIGLSTTVDDLVGLDENLSTNDENGN